ncbi:MAG: hypothetical protein EXS14_06480 [Planctomycetes bacterium]|nr:hypothetical protein [Planctomycetota bacterium]
MGRNDLEFLSLALGIVGTFFICAAVQVKRPKHILEDAFGVVTEHLREVRSAVLKRNNLFMGFGCNVIALLLLIFSRNLDMPEHYVLLDGCDAFGLGGILLGFGVLLGMVLHWASRIYGRRYFRRMVFEVVTENRLPLETNVALAIEVGTLLGVTRDPDDTVESYIVKLRQRLNLPRSDERMRLRAR